MTLTSSAANQATASKLVFNTQPSNTVSLVAMSSGPVVYIEDSSGNIITTGPDATAKITLSLSTGSGTLGGTKTMSAVAGVADFTGDGLNIDTVGTGDVLTATKTSTTDSGGVGVLTQTSSSFNITNGPATQLVFHTNPGGGTAGVLWSAQPVVYIQDTSNNLVTSGSDATDVITLTPSSATLHAHGCDGIHSYCNRQRRHCE